MAVIEDIKRNISSRINSFQLLSQNESKPERISQVQSLLRFIAQIKAEAVSSTPYEEGENTALLNHINLCICQRFLKQLRSDVIYYCSDIIANYSDSAVTTSILMARVQPLMDFGWLSLFRKSVSEAFRLTVVAQVESICSGEYQAPHIANLQAWMKKVLVPCAKDIFQIDDTKSHKSFIFELDGYLMDSLVALRSSEMFDIVTEFPESLPALRELKDACSLPSSLGKVGKVFRSIVCKRLLHPGASTFQILEMYVAMIRALRVLDPSDLLLDYIASPVRQYLMSRNDTVRCVVSSLIAEKNEKGAMGSEKNDIGLQGELRRGGSLEYGANEEDEDAGPGVNWKPRKRDPGFNETGIRGLDVLALLVSIYGTTEVFVNEYRLLLAETLIANLSYNTDREVATLEHLKKRFGEETLHDCEVMLHDVEESKRTNATVCSELELNLRASFSSSCAARPSPSSSGVGDIEAEAKRADFVIVSENYWPSQSLAQSSDAGSADFSHFIPHPAAASCIEAYREAYAALKKPRQLHVVQERGLVTLSLDFEDRSTRTFSVWPVQAHLIMYLADQGCTTLAALAVACGLDEAFVKRKMSFWLSKGVVRARSVTSSDNRGENDKVTEKEQQSGGGDIEYQVVEQQAALAAADSMAEAQGKGQVDRDSEEDENAFMSTSLGGAEGAAAAAHVRAAQLVSIQKYIKGMLSSHGSMTLEAIHSMLKLVATGGRSGTGGGGSSEEAKYDMSIVELRRFLQSLIESSVLECVSGRYTLQQVS